MTAWASGVDDTTVHRGTLRTTPPSIEMLAAAPAATAAALDAPEVILAPAAAPAATAAAAFPPVTAIEAAAATAAAAAAALDCPATVATLAAEPAAAAAAVLPPLAAAAADARAAAVAALALAKNEARAFTIAGVAVLKVGGVTPLRNCWNCTVGDAGFSWHSGVGASVGANVGNLVGASVGVIVGNCVGTAVGVIVGWRVGLGVGSSVGMCVGAGVGVSVGRTPANTRVVSQGCCSAREQSGQKSVTVSAEEQAGVESVHDRPLTALARAVTGCRICSEPVAPVVRSVLLQVAAVDRRSALVITCGQHDKSHL
jgi:outer membrane lipoprotein SlyB